VIGVGTSGSVLSSVRTEDKTVKLLFSVCIFNLKLNPKPNSSPNSLI